VHDEMLTLFDDCITRMLQLRANLAVARRVHPGERHEAVVSAIEVAARFASEATRTVAPAAMPATRPAAVRSVPGAAVPPVVDVPDAVTPPRPARLDTRLLTAESGSVRGGR
jgi:hypothetical protein